MADSKPWKVEMARLEGTMNALAEEVSEIKTALGAHIEQMNQFMTRIETSAIIPADVIQQASGSAVNKRITVKGLDHFYVEVELEAFKLETVCDICETLGGITQSVVFVNTRDKVDWLTDQMRCAGYAVTETVGDMDPDTRVLITTGALAPCIDAPVVINYDLPTQPKDYLLHIGRFVINFVTTEEQGMLNDIQQFHHFQVDPLQANFADLLSS